MLAVVAGPAAGQEFPLPVGHFLIGRDPANDVTIADPLISKRHARIEVATTFVELVDLNSANGILVDGGRNRRRIDRVSRLVHPARIAHFPALEEPIDRLAAVLRDQFPKTVDSAKYGCRLRPSVQDGGFKQSQPLRNILGHAFPEQRHEPQ